ncbi:hypothetical protein CLV93_10667 [Prolixibacter denitrificans]|uniref:Uncharacterized protein n=1 Tax=Prolixibacter denitrificans TaxID=1541063 RepID=A0A2P8CBG8_9BACT|nr:hypothetical protein CLV93_10667 [Prolixibacter denitrificans]
MLLRLSNGMVVCRAVMYPKKNPWPESTESNQGFYNYFSFSILLPAGHFAVEHQVEALQFVGQFHFHRYRHINGFQHGEREDKSPGGRRMFLIV